MCFIRLFKLTNYAKMDGAPFDANLRCDGSLTVSPSRQKNL